MKENINKEELIESLKGMHGEINELGAWSPTNAMRLRKYNIQHLAIADQLISNELMHWQSWHYTTDETNKEIDIANTNAKNKKDEQKYTKYYGDGVRHLKDQINGLISLLMEK